VYNMMYELIGFCSSTVAQDAQGNVWHGRNLDFGPPRDSNPCQRRICRLSYLRVAHRTAWRWQASSWA